MTTRTYIAASSEPPVRCVPVDLTVPHLAASRRIVPCICSRRRSWSWSRYPRRTGRTPWCSTSPCPLVSWLHSASCRMWTESRRGHKISSEHSQGAAMTADPEGIQMPQKTSVSIFFLFFYFYNKIITFFNMFWLHALYTKKFTGVEKLFVSENFHKKKQNKKKTCFFPSIACDINPIFV